MTKKQEIHLHIGFWVVFIGMNLYSDWITYGNITGLWDVLQFISFAILQAIVFYLNYSWICKYAVPKKKWSFFIIGQIGLVLLFSGLRYLFQEIIIFRITGLHNYNMNNLTAPYYIFDNSFYATRIILFSLVLYFLKTIWNANKKMNELLLQKKQAEMQNLKNKMSPHFLFNTLNSFYSDLMDKQPQIAEDILKLSDMLRYITYENENDFVYLKDEIRFIRNYIALFSRRYENQLAIEFQVGEYESEAKIPSLLLINFVENTFKHGVIADFKRPVSFKIETRDNYLNFTSENYFVNSKNYDEKGIGNKNVRQRLDILYPENYVLDIEETQNLYQVKLQIPLIK